VSVGFVVIRSIVLVVVSVSVVVMLSECQMNWIVFVIVSCSVVVMFVL